MTEWFARPVLHVTHVAASLRFYVDRLGFMNPWHYGEQGKPFVAQVDRQGCALILSSQWPEKVGKGLMFISLNVEPDTREAQVEALDALRAELEANGAPPSGGCGTSSASAGPASASARGDRAGSAGRRRRNACCACRAARGTAATRRGS